MAAVKASYHVSEIIADIGKPLCDGDYIKKCLLKAVEALCPEKKQNFMDVSLPANTVTRRISDISGVLTDNLKKKAMKFKYFSIAIDESNDIVDTAQLLIFVRGVSEQFEITEELLSLRSMKGTTKGAEIFEQLQIAINEMGLDFKNFTSLTSDGARNMVGGKRI